MFNWIKCLLTTSALYLCFWMDLKANIFYEIHRPLLNKDHKANHSFVSLCHLSFLPFSFYSLSVSAWSSCSPFPTLNSVSSSFMNYHHNSHYFPSSVLWLLSIPSHSIVISRWSFRPWRLKSFSSPSKLHLIKRASSKNPGIYQSVWCNALVKAKDTAPRCFMFQEPCFEVAYFVRVKGKRLVLSQWQHSVNWIKSTWRPVGLKRVSPQPEYHAECKIKALNLSLSLNPCQQQGPQPITWACLNINKINRRMRAG